MELEEVKAKLSRAEASKDVLEAELQQQKEQLREQRETFAVMSQVAAQDGEQGVVNNLGNGHGMETVTKHPKTNRDFSNNR